MSLNVRRPDDVLLDFAPSPAVAKEATHVVGALTAPDAPARGTAAELLFTRTVVLHGDNTAAAIAAKRQEILDSFHRTFSVYEKLFEVIASDEAYYMRPDALRHPLIFYYGHTAVLYINKLVTAQVLTDRVNEQYESMLAVGVDEMSWDDLNETSYEWPTVADVKKYRDTVRAIVDRLIRTLPLQFPITWTSPWWIILLGIEHERIHLETSSVLIRQLPINQVVQHPLWPVCELESASGAAVEGNAQLPVPARHLDLGKPADHHLYGWDNEYGSHAVHVPSFTASQYLCSNREFLAFVLAGGYENSSLWTDEGWRWKLYRKATHPVFWVPQRPLTHGAEGVEAAIAAEPFRLRQMTHETAMHWDWPVEVNYLEAKAFCTWKSALTGKPIRLPTEEEYAALRLHVLPESVDIHNWKQAPGNINLEHWASSTPVDAHPFKHGFYDVIGNVWQWTETPIDEFDGFRVHPVYDDFSVPTFDTRHNIIKGGSWISCGNEATFHARYAFRRHFFQHAGFRYVESTAPTHFRPDLFERDPKVGVALEAHYGPAHLGVPNFAVQLATLVNERAAALGKSRDRVLDIGCGAGRTTFELARHCAYVLGLDLSTRFFRLAVELKDRGAVFYALPEEGARTVEVGRRLTEVAPHLTADVLQRTEFLQADACNLDARYKAFDIVVAAQLLEHCYAPRNFLCEIHRRVNAGGLLVVASTYAWDAAVTPRDEWLGGDDAAASTESVASAASAASSAAVSSADAVRALLTAEGRFVELAAEQCDLPFVVRKQARKFTHGVAHVMFFERQ